MYKITEKVGDVSVSFESDTAGGVIRLMRCHDEYNKEKAIEYDRIKAKEEKCPTTQ